jgi:hypothetical protein
MSIQDQIDAKQQMVSAIKGNVSGVPPASCNIADLEAQIVILQSDIKTLRANQLEEENPFQGTTMTLRFGNGNTPSLTGANPAAVAMINAIGVRPAAVLVDEVTVNASGGSGISMMVMGETDIMTAAEKLAAFAEDRGIVVDFAQVNKAKEENVNRAAHYTDLAEQQSEIIEKFAVAEPPIEEP